mmetsp:Transcript_398/g.1005  ORF Transcript_398/g.1005 Transcript_398/m.1005 type:complete len:136 (-) Transcript_398:1478-1885(-)
MWHTYTVPMWHTYTDKTKTTFLGAYLFIKSILHLTPLHTTSLPFFFARTATNRRQHRYKADVWRRKGGAVLIVCYGSVLTRPLQVLAALPTQCLCRCPVLGAGPWSPALTWCRCLGPSAHLAPAGAGASTRTVPV